MTTKTDTLPMMEDPTTGDWDWHPQPEARRLIEAAGATIVEDIDRAAFTELMDPVWKQFATTPELRSLLRSIRETGDTDG